MKLTITGKRIDVGDALRQRVTESLEASIAKYFDRPLEAQVTFSREGNQFRADIIAHVGRGIVVQGHALADDAYVAFDRAEERIAKRLRRHKRRLRDHKGAEGIRIEAAQHYILAEEPEDGEETGDGVADAPAVVAELEAEIRTMTVGEAVMHMDLSDQPALMFRNSAHGGLNMIYRRPDGHIGWVDPQGAPSTSEPQSS